MTPNKSTPSNTLTPAYIIELLDAVPTGIIVTKQDGCIIYVNAETERLFGYSRTELLNHNVDILLPDRFSHDHARLRQSYVAEPSTRYMGAGRDLYGRRKNASEFPLEVGLRPLNTEGQQFIVASVVDISARKRLEERFAKVIEASPYGQLLVDEHGVIQLINPSLLTLFGYAKEELLGQSMDILLPERYRHSHTPLREGYTRAPTLRAMGLGRDLTGRHKNGTEIPIEIGLSPVTGEKGQFVLAVVTDISERKRLELNLEQANAHMEEFNYVASHDLKSPLRGISDLMEWIEDDLGEQVAPAVTKNIQRVKVRIGRMENLIDDLLRYAQAGKRAKESDLIEVSDLINNIVELHPVPDTFKITQKINIQQIQTARTPLETVLRNLFTNALKHHDGLNPEITISAEAHGNYCLFTVKDNGPGVPTSARERVFRLFQTLDDSTTAGSGIGLALAKRLTEGHGGQIELIDNGNERGCSFLIKWPRFARKDLDEQ